MRTAVFMTSGVVLMLWQGNTSPGRLADIEGRTITTENFHRRPFRQHGNRYGGVWRELIGGVNDLATDDGEHGFDAFDALVRQSEVIVGERGQVGELTDGDHAFLATLAAEPTAALRIESQGFFAAQTIFVRIHRRAT